MRTVLVGYRGLIRYLLGAMLRADWDFVGILGAAGALETCQADCYTAGGVRALLVEFLFQYFQNESYK